MYELAQEREDVVVGLDMGNGLNRDRVVSLDELPPELITLNLKVGDYIPPEYYRYRPEVPGAVEGTKTLINKYGQDAVKIFKNSVLGDFSDEQALGWIEQHDFNRRTGGLFTIDRNLFLPESREDKAFLWERELVTDAVEDRIQVGKHIIPCGRLRWIWMLPNPKELMGLKPYVDYPPPEVQARMRVAYDWTGVLELISDRTWGRIEHLEHLDAGRERQGA